MNDMGKRIREYREKLSFSQEFVARQIGLNRSSIAKIEAGNQSLKSTELDKLALLFGVTADEILRGNDSNYDEARVFARAIDGLSENDKKEILNLIEFKKSLKWYY